MAQNNKTISTQQAVDQFISSVEHAQRHADALELLKIFGRLTGWAPQMWGPSIVGYGRYQYKYESGREGEAMVTGFSPRKASLSIYIMPGYRDLSEKLSRLGKHRIGKACLYVNKLSDVDAAVLEEIIMDGVTHMRANYETSAS